MTSRGCDLHQTVAVATLLSSMWLQACRQFCSLQSALTTKLTLTSCPPMPVLLVLSKSSSSQRSRGVRSPRSGEDTLLLPLAQPGFLNGPCCYGVASCQWFRFLLDWQHLPSPCSLFLAAALLGVTSLLLMVPLYNTVTNSFFLLKSLSWIPNYRLSSCQNLDSVNIVVLI